MQFKWYKIPLGTEVEVSIKIVNISEKEED